MDSRKYIFRFLVMEFNPELRSSNQPPLPVDVEQLSIEQREIIRKKVKQLLDEHVSPKNLANTKKSQAHLEDRNDFLLGIIQGLDILSLRDRVRNVSLGNNIDVNQT